MGTANTPPDSEAVNVEVSPQVRRERRRALWSSFIGTTVEYYDFLLYGTAASLIFPTLFFNDLGALGSVLASFGTLAVGYFARPVGGIVFGHFGDRLGRKRILVITIILMGASSFLMGLLPTTATAGVIAPILLVTLRLVQGFAVGGEWAGAALMSMEHASPKGRGLAASVVASGGPSGAVLATLVLGAFGLLPEEAFNAWGWRVPFLLSAILVIVALYLRTRVQETPEFTAATANIAVSAVEADGAAKQQAPIARILRHYPGRLAVAILGVLAPLFIQSILATFILTFATQNGHDRAVALWLITGANFLHIFTITGAAALSDRIGRKPVMVTGAVAGILLIGPLFWLVSEGQWWTLLLAFIIGNPIVQGLMYGPIGAWMAEKFPTEARYTGVSLTYQIGSTLGAGLAPLAATWLLALGGGSDPVYVIWLFAGLCVLAIVAYSTGRETSRDERLLRHADLRPTADSAPSRS